MAATTTAAGSAALASFATGNINSSSRITQANIVSQMKRTS